MDMQMNVTNVKELASLVKKERQSRGWTQAELAKRVGVSRDWIIGLEKAKPSVELALVMRALKALELKLTTSPSSPPASPSSRYLDSLKSHQSPKNTPQGDED